MSGVASDASIIRAADDTGYDDCSRTVAKFGRQCLQCSYVRVDDGSGRDTVEQSALLKLFAGKHAWKCWGTADYKFADGDAVSLEIGTEIE